MLTTASSSFHSPLMAGKILQGSDRVEAQIAAVERGHR
jgi:hypothetical protein